MKQRSINVILFELRQAYAQGDKEAVTRLSAERKAWTPTRRSKPPSAESRARRRAFARLWG